MSKKNAEAVLEEDNKLSQKNEELKDIDILATELNINDAILAGIMTMKSWRKGKMLTKEELEEALLKFLNKTL